MSGFIKIHRQIVDWEWYTDIPVRILFEHCLFKANYETKKWRGTTIERGSFITSYENLALETGLTIRQIRTALNKLKTTGEVTHETTSQYSIITIKNWEKYQTSDTQNDKQMTSERQTSDKRATTTKEIKEVKEVKENNTHTNKKSVCVNLTNEDKKILIRYAEKSKARNIDAYINTLLRNGGYLQILEKAKKIKQAKEEKERRKKLTEITDRGVTAAEAGYSLKDILKKRRGNVDL